MPYQQRFVRGLLKNAEAALTIARANGKTTLAAALAACAVAGPISQPRAQTVIVASSFGQARIGFHHTMWFLRPIFEQDRRRWRVVDNSHECRIEDRETGANLRALGSDPGRAHGLAPLLAIADEPAQWPANFGPKMHAAIVTAQGKIEASRFVAIGTKPEEPLHWFSEMLTGGPGIYVQSHAVAADDEADYAWASVRKANPALPYLPALRAALKRERQKARESAAALAMWRALRLNKGTAETGMRQVITSVDNWLGCVFEPPPPREGPVAIGFDLGGSSSMTAFVAYWPQTGRLEARGAFPADPGLKDRGKDDGVGDRYVRMAERGEIRTYPGRVTPVGKFLVDMAGLLKDQEVIGAVADRYRKAEAEQALAVAAIEWPMEWRAVGSGPHGSADIRAFQSEVLEAHLRTAPSMLMESAIRESIVTRDTNRNPRLDKARNKGRIDALQAAVLAVGMGRRWRLPSPDEEDSDLLSHYSAGEPVETYSV